jgi:hypothetical protein
LTTHFAEWGRKRAKIFAVSLAQNHANKVLTLIVYHAQAHNALCLVAVEHDKIAAAKHVAVLGVCLEKFGGC